MAERYSAKSSLIREKMRIISGITALNLIEEKRFAEAEVYRKPFVEIKECSIEDLAQGLGFGFVPNPSETKKLAADIISIAKLLSQDPETLRPDEIKKSMQRLVELLNVVSNIRL